MRGNHVPEIVICARRMTKMKSECALYRAERVGDKDYYYTREYCDGLIDPYCAKGKSCPFYKWSGTWMPIVVKKQTQYVRREG